MNDLISHMVKPLLSKPDLLKIAMSSEEDDALIRVDVFVAEEDLESLRGEEGKTERALRHLLSIASGAKKPFLTLKTLEDEDSESEREASDEGEAEESSGTED